MGSAQEQRGQWMQQARLRKWRKTQSSTQLHQALVSARPPGRGAAPQLINDDQRPRGGALPWVESTRHTRTVRQAASQLPHALERRHCAASPGSLGRTNT